MIYFVEAVWADSGAGGCPEGIVSVYIHAAERQDIYNDAGVGTKGKPVLAGGVKAFLMDKITSYILVFLFTANEHGEIEIPCIAGAFARRSIPKFLCQRAYEIEIDMGMKKGLFQGGEDFFERTLSKVIPIHGGDIGHK